MNRSIALGATLTMLIAVPVMANDLIFVTLPVLAAELGAGPGQIQVAISSYMVSYAVLQLAYGALSDRYGRRPILFIGLVIFVAGAVLCAVANGLGLVIAARVLQGIGSGAGPTLARAVLRDLYGPERSGRVLSYIMSWFGIIAISAPMIGGGLAENFGWRAVFFFAAVYGLVCLFMVWRCLPETAPGSESAGNARRIFHSFFVLLASRNFVLLALSNSLLYAAMFSWLAGVAFVLIDGLGLSADGAGIWFAVSLSGFAIGSALAGRVSRRFSALQLVAAGTMLCLAASVVGCGLALAGVANAVALIAPGFVIMAGVGMVIPPATASGIAPFPEMAGAASSLIGFFQMAFAALAVMVVGYLFDGTAFPMMFEMACLTAAGLAVFAPLARNMSVRVLPR